MVRLDRLTCLPNVNQLARLSGGLPQKSQVLQHGLQLQGRSKQMPHIYEYNDWATVFCFSFCKTALQLSVSDTP